MRFSGKKLVVKLFDPVTDALWGKILQFAKQRSLSDVLLTTSGYLLMISGLKRIYLNNGPSTLQVAIDLLKVPEFDQSCHLSPTDFLVKNYSDYTTLKDSIAYRMGQMFEDDQLSHVFTESTNRRNIAEENLFIVETPTSELIKSGRVSIHQMRSVLLAKDAWEDITANDTPLPDLMGSHTMTFQYRGAKTNSHTPHHQSQVTIRGYPGDTTVKRKHYYIYSTYGGYGKTYEKDAFVSKYNACNVTDVRNWSSIRKNAQFLCLDEVGPHCKIPFCELKALTGGSSTGFSGNRKSYGKSFEPRDDVQVIMFSNLSPYQLYGEWDRQKGGSLMCPTTYQQFMERFHVHRLDGHDSENIIQHVHSDAWEERHSHFVHQKMIEKLDEMSRKTHALSAQEVDTYLSKEVGALDVLILNILEFAIPILTEIVELYRMLFILSGKPVTHACFLLKCDILTNYNMDDNIFAPGVTFAHIFKLKH